jgi:hypothetical protein
MDDGSQTDVARFARFSVPVPADIGATMPPHHGVTPDCSQGTFEVRTFVTGPRSAPLLWVRRALTCGARRRTGGRPRARRIAVRSGARSGDSGDSDSDGPPRGWPPLAPNNARALTLGGTA